MKRRNFLGGVTLAAGGWGALAAGRAETRTVTWTIKGFTCPTCAVGLQVMLSDQKGVQRAEVSYPEATATVSYDPKIVTEEQLCAFVAELGFTAQARVK